MLGSNLNIMTPQWLDVVFKDRNQAYGAYELRSNNGRNTLRALIIAVTVFVLALSLPTVVNIIKGFIPPPPEKIDVTTVDLTPPPMLEKTKVEPPKVEKQVTSKQDVIKYLPPVVKPDVDAHEDPPTEKAIEKAELGQQNIKGNPNGADVAIDEKIGPKDIDGVTESTNTEGTVFTLVEINPEFPGGDAAFNKYLSSHIRYPNVAKENNVQGRVFIQFIVERDGSLTDLKALRDPGSGLGEEAMRVLKSMPHWKPGIQNGKPVRVQYTVPVNFSLAE